MLNTEKSVSLYSLWKCGQPMEKLIIQSDINNLFDVEVFVTDICDTYNINNYAAAISVSLLQAVKNSIVHGNMNDKSKTVTITTERFKGGIAFTVTDEGDGFDFNCYGDIPTSPGMGRGIYLMKTLSDDVTFYNHGRTVRLDFYVVGIDASHSLERNAALKRFYSNKKVNA